MGLQTKILMPIKLFSLYLHSSIFLKFNHHIYHRNLHRRSKLVCKIKHGLNFTQTRQLNCGIIRTFRGTPTPHCPIFNSS